MSRNTFIFSLALVGLIASALLISTRFESVAIANQQEQVNEQSKQEFVSYKVRAGDNLYRLSQDFYGNPRLWQAIANENGFGSANELKAGQEIRIPVLSKDEINASTAIAATQAKVVSPINIQPDAAMTASADSDSFDQRAPLFAEAVQVKSKDFDNVFATVIARDGGAFLKVTGRSGDFAHEICNQDIRPIGGHYRFSFLKDINDDGSEELFTVWKVGSDDYYTQEITWNGQGFAISAVHPNSPFAIGFEPEDLSLNAELMRLAKAQNAND